MIKILYFTDAHIRGTNPRARVDDYRMAINRKMQEVIAIAEEEECEAIVCGGDLFDRPDTAPAIVGDLIQMFRATPAPIYTVAGNHEIYGYNPESLPRTMLGLLERTGLVHTLWPSGPTILTDGTISVALTGCPFYHDIDRGADDYMTRIVPTSKAIRKVWHVHVVHGMLVEKPLPYEVAHTLIKDCKTNADVILSGHEHLGYGLIRRPDGVWFCNPGALGRVSAKVEEMHRPVQVAMFTFTEDGVSADLITLKSARPGDEVLSRDHLVAAAEREERTAQFLSLLGEEREQRLLDVREIVDFIADKEEIHWQVRTDALYRIGQAREHLTA